MNSQDSGRFEELLSPLAIGTKTARNRAVITAHSGFQPWTPAGSHQYAGYLRARARGGVGLIIAQPILVEPFLDWPSPVADQLAEVAAAVHEEGGLVIVQLVNYGAQNGARALLGGRPMWSLNGGVDRFGESSHRMTGDEVEVMVEAFARAARVATQVGLDGVELHGAHGYLLNQSYSKWGNGRDDEWGDPLAFSRAVIAATRTAMGTDSILGYRFCANDLLRADESSQSPAEVADIARELVADGLIDLVNSSVGVKAPAYAQIAIGSYRHPANYDIPFARGLRDAISARVPVIGVGGVTDPLDAEAALRRGDCDLVGLTRAHIADPAFMNRVAAGRVEAIRPCVRANVCVNHVIDRLEITCFHNPAMGREHLFTPAVPASDSLRVTIVGAGPGGLMAAHTALRLGHQVVVVEQDDEAGGRLRHLRRTRASALLRTVDWLVARIEAAGGRLEFDTAASAAGLVRWGPDAVIIATGARSATRGFFDGDDRSQVVTAETVLATPGSLGRVVVLDRAGGLEAALTAEALLERCDALRFVTPFERFAPSAGFTVRLDLVDALHRSPVASVRTELDLHAFDGTSVTLTGRDGEIVEAFEVDTIVVCGAPAPTPLPVDGRLGPWPTFTIGDALAPRDATVAMREGFDVAHRLARASATVGTLASVGR